MCEKFSQKIGTVLQKLERVIQQRRNDLSPDSYTTTLFLAGIEKIAAKLAEESLELIDAAKICTTESAKEQVTHEAADLMYHFLVLLAACDVTLLDVEQELARRFGVSGLIEKASRKIRLFRKH